MRGCSNEIAAIDGYIQELGDFIRELGNEYGGLAAGVVNELKRLKAKRNLPSGFR